MTHLKARPSPETSLLVPAGVGELLSIVVSKLSPIYDLGVVSSESIGRELLSITRSLVKAEHYELFYRTSGDSPNLSPLEGSDLSRMIPLDNRSLIGFIGQNKLFQIFNNPGSSPLFSSFPVQFWPWEDASSQSSICGVPILFPTTGELYAVLMMYNKQDRSGFLMDDVHLTQSVGSILTGHLLTTGKFPSQETHDKNKNRYKELQKWCKKVFVVTNTTEKKQLLAKSILQQIYSDPSPEVLLHCAIHLLTSLINTEETRIVYRIEGQYLIISSSKTLVTNIATQDESALYDQVKDQALFLQKTEQFENLALFPVDDSSLIIQLINKKDDSLASYIDYSKSDVSLITNIGLPMLGLVRHFVDATPFDIYELRVQLKELVGSLNSQPIIATIRTASQELLGCDRGSVFIRNKDDMVITAQGEEQDLPVGFSVPIGKGIVGLVAQSGSTENIPDVYQDSRFNQDVDMLTGYTTRSMLCMPVFDNNSQVIAALQMINKHAGQFDAYDEETLDLFSEMVSSVLINCELFQRNLEERTRLVNILNSLGTYILVLNENGKLGFSNKPIEGLLGINDKTARKSHYSLWLRQNRQLVADVTKVYQEPAGKITRNSQKLSVLTDKISVFIFNYTIRPLQEVSGESAGAIIILEDATAMESLNVKYKKVKSKLIALIEPVKTLNSLQVCIQKLENIASSIDKEDISEELMETILTLKRGNLHKIEMHIPQSLDSQVRSRIKEYNTDAVTPKFRSSLREFNFDRTDNQIIDNWDVNFLEVKDYLGCVHAMLSKLELFDYFRISSDKLRIFLEEVQIHYDVNKNPYHNFSHGMTVMHSSYHLIVHTNGYTSFNHLEILSILIASLCHDINHTGHNNAFEIQSESGLATLYNDISVLESHHAAFTFKILKEENFNIFECLSEDDFKIARKLMIECILATDMGKHFRIITDMNARLGQVSESPIGSFEEDPLKLGGLLVHSADIAHPTKEFNLYHQWSKLVCQEFSLQVQEEVKLGIPTTEFMMGLDDPLRYYKNEVGFLSVIVKPLWDCMAKWLSIDHLMKNLDFNLQEFKRRLSDLEDGI